MALPIVIGIPINLLSEELGSVPSVVLITIVLAAIAMVTWATLAERAIAAGPLTQSEVLIRAEQDLADAVRRQCERESSDRAVDDPYPMPVRWRHAPEHQDHPDLIGDRLPVVLGRGDRMELLVATFRRLRRRRLVVLGAPGTGKTTLAVQLVLDLVRHRDPATPGEQADPVPVLLTLSDWNTHVYPELWDWLTARLERDFDGLRAVAPGAAAGLVAARRVLPVLDGLDEVPEQVRPRILSALNASIGTSPVVLTCRTDEFTRAVISSDVVSAAMVVEAQPLTPTEIAEYLAHAVPRDRQAIWAPLLTAIRRCAPAAEVITAVCARPLGLWLTRVVVADAPDGSPDRLLSPTGRHPDPNDPATDSSSDRSNREEVGRGREAAAGQLQDELLAELVSTLLRVRVPRESEPGRPARRWASADATRYLATLARSMNRARTRDLLWWQLPALTTPRPVRVGLRLLTALPAFSYLVGLFAIPTHTEPTTVLILAAIMAVVPAAAGRLVVGRRSGQVVRLHRFSARELLGVAGLILIVPAYALQNFLVRNFLYEIGFSQESGKIPSDSLLVVLVAAVVLIEIGRRLRRPVEFDDVMTAKSTYVGDRAANLVPVLAAASVLVMLLLMPAVLYNPALTSIGRLLFGFGVVALAGVVVAIPAVGGSWLSCASAARLLAVRGLLPWRLWAFLDDAHRLGLLRAVGPTYQFRHAELQDHLARTAAS